MANNDITTEMRGKKVNPTMYDCVCASCGDKFSCSERASVCLKPECQRFAMKAGSDDMVNHPKHYELFPGVQVLEIVKGAIKFNKLTGNESYPYGNVLKYLLRCGNKGKKVEDLKKAEFYLKELIAEAEGK